MNEYSVKKMSEYPVNPSPLSEDLIPTITVEGGKFVNRNIEFSKLKGDKGDTGPQGEPGDDGNTGASGKAATVEVGSVSTGPAGSSATVENTGDGYDAVLDFTIPKGDKGDQGDPGVVQSVNGKSQADVVLDTDDIDDTATNRYTNDTDIARLADTSGENTGDQDLSGLTTDAELTAGLATKEPTITAGTTPQYYRGDKTWQTLNTTAVGIPNVDNTSDMDKPVSTAQGVALNLKEDLSNKSTSTALGTSDTLYPTQNAVKTYVDTQDALKQDKISVGSFSVPYRDAATVGALNTSLQVTQGSPTNNSIARRTGTGTLIVATPTAVNEATTKLYVDTADALKVNKAGDNMTGQLIGKSTLANPSTQADYAFVSGVLSMGSAAGGVGRIQTFSNQALYLNAVGNPVYINGVGYLTGTGFPNSVVSAPVGSIYIDTAVTNGASSWIKTSGAGNTGWVVENGDTGSRLINSLLEAGALVQGNVIVRLKNNTVSIYLQGVEVSSGSPKTILANISTLLGTPFAPSGIEQRDIPNLSSTTSNGTVAVGPAEGIRVIGSTGRFWMAFTYTNNNTTWPTTLPGTAV